MADDDGFQSTRHTVKSSQSTHHNAITSHGQLIGLGLGLGLGLELTLTLTQSWIRALSVGS